MLCPFCRAGFKFIRTYETIRHRNMVERRKLCESCGSAWKTVEQKTDPIVETNGAEQKQKLSVESEEQKVPFPKVMLANERPYEKPNYLKIRKALETNS